MLVKVLNMQLSDVLFETRRYMRNQKVKLIYDSQEVGNWIRRGRDLLHCVLVHSYHFQRIRVGRRGWACLLFALLGLRG